MSEFLYGGYPSELVSGLTGDAERRIRDDPEFPGWRIPFDVFAEEAFIGILLRARPEWQAEMLELITPEEFYWGQDRRILELAAQLFASQAPLTFDTLEAALREAGEWSGSGWPERFVHLENETLAGNLAEAEFYAGKVRERARLRRLWDLRELISELLTTRGLTAEAAETEITRYLTEQPQRKAEGPGDLDSAVAREIGRIESGQETRTLKFGMETIDRLTGGLEAGEVGVVCGQPGSGKTCFTLMQALHAAEYWGPLAVISLEMGRSRLALRLLAMHSRFSFHEIRTGRHRDGRPFTPADRQELKDAYARFGDYLGGIHVECDCYGLESLVAAVRRLRLQHGIQAVILDYGQLVSVEQSRGDRWQELGCIARSLKTRLAEPFNLPVWCLVQPNQDSKRVDKNGNARLLQPGDMFGGMEWEAVANQVWFLNRDPQAPPPRPGVLETEKPILLHVHKSRDGGTGMVALTLLGERFKFVERTDRYGEPQ